MSRAKGIYTRELKVMGNEKPEKVEYTDHERAKFLELAQEIGISKAMRELGFPKHWSTGQKWAKAAGIDVSLNKVMENARKFHTFYETEDMLTVVEAGIERVREAYVESKELDADSQKKLAESMQKLGNTWLLLQGKANSINEKRETTTFDVELASLLDEQRRLNQEQEESID